MPVYTANVDGRFEGALLDASDRLGASDPRELLVILFAESSVTPGADLQLKDAQGVVRARFLGINQFWWDPGGKGTFATSVPGLTPEQYLALPASAQLSRYVLPFWQAQRARFGPNVVTSARDLYWVNFLPGTYVPDAPDDHVITRDAATIAANPGLARGKPFIQAGDLSAFLLHRQAQEPHRWTELLDRVEEAMGLRPDPVGALYLPGVPGGVAGPARAGLGVGLFLAAAAGVGYALSRRGA